MKGRETNDDYQEEKVRKRMERGVQEAFIRSLNGCIVLIYYAAVPFFFWYSRLSSNKDELTIPNLKNISTLCCL